MADRIDKDRFEPAYAQLAAILRRQIAAGTYPPGAKIPSESSISRKYGLSVMTVRQAIGVLIAQGLIERVQGSGTFVKPVTLTGSRFDLGGMKEVFEDPERIRVKVLHIRLTRTDEKAARMLRQTIGDRIISIRRLLLRDSRPVMSHEGYIRYDPANPVVEAELSLGPLCDLFNGHGGGIAKKGELTVIPTVLNMEEARILDEPTGTPVFRLEYLVYDFDDIPFGWGWYTAAPRTLSLETRLGLWDDKKD
jgi:DNA-binding GntR family transcriptional regulator